MKKPEISAHTRVNFLERVSFISEVLSLVFGLVFQHYIMCLFTREGYSILIVFSLFTSARLFLSFQSWISRGI